MTLSNEQHRIATERAHAEGLSDRVTFLLCNYRNVSGPFDRIVSVGIFEHVGRWCLETGGNCQTASPGT